MSHQEWWRALFACIDAKQTRQFLTYLSPDALFRYGSAPPAIGHAAIGTMGRIDPLVSKVPALKDIAQLGQGGTVSQIDIQRCHRDTTFVNRLQIGA